MIESLNSWVRNVLMLVLCISFMEMVLPGGKLSKFVRFTFGLLIIASIIDPIISIKGDIENFQIDLFGEKSQELEFEEIEGQWEELVLANYNEKLTTQIETVLYCIDGIKDADVNLYIKSDGSIGKVNVEVMIDEKNNIGEYRNENPSVSIFIPRITVEPIGSGASEKYYQGKEMKPEESRINELICGELMKHLNIPSDLVNVSIL